MTVEIAIAADFVRHPEFPASENCEKCFAGFHKLCLKTIEGIHDRCHYGQQGYWAFKGIEGKAE